MDSKDDIEGLPALNDWWDSLEHVHKAAVKNVFNVFTRHPAKPVPPSSFTSREERSSSVPGATGGRGQLNMVEGISSNRHLPKGTEKVAEKQPVLSSPKATPTKGRGRPPSNQKIMSIVESPKAGAKKVADDDCEWEGVDNTSSTNSGVLQKDEDEPWPVKRSRGRPPKNDGKTMTPARREGSASKKLKIDIDHPQPSEQRKTRGRPPKSTTDSGRKELEEEWEDLVEGTSVTEGKDKLIGRKIKKKFDGKYYHGKVTKVLSRLRISDLSRMPATQSIMHSPASQPGSRQWLILMLTVDDADADGGDCQFWGASQSLGFNSSPCIFFADDSQGRKRGVAEPVLDRLRRQRRRGTDL